MCIGGRLGIDLTLNTTPDQTPVNLFGETNGCILAEISPEDALTFEKEFSGLPLKRIGTVTADPILKLMGDEIPIFELVKAFNLHT